MTKPRESLLNLFDPLARAGAGSSTTQGEFTDLSSSDKENSSPSLTNTDVKDTNLTMTKFFSRTYSHDQYMTKPLPQGALIDFDVSMANSAEGDSDDENVFDARLGLDNIRKLANGSAKKPLATPRRKVLADIPAAESVSPFGLLDATPIGFKEISQRSAPSPTPLFFPPVVSSTQECALDDPPSPSTAIAAVVTPVIPVLNTPAPSSPDYIHSSTLHGSGYQRDRRESLDLHTSFNMHLHDTSFDLLNDRISLLESDSLIGSEQSAEDIAVSVEPTTHDNSVREGVSSAEEESDRGGLADVESDSDADATGAVLHRLAAIALDSVAEPETEITSNPLNPLALITPKIHPIASAAPRAPHPNKLLARSCGEPVGAPEPEDTHKVIGRAPRPQEAHAPAAPIAALRIVKKAKPTSHARSLSRSVASGSIEHVATRTASPPSHLSRIPASAEVLPQLKPLGSRSQKAAPSAKQTCAAPAPRPSTASLLKYGPQGRKREAVVGRAPSVSRHSTSSVARDHMSQLQLDAATADATDPALPTIRTSSGIRPPSRFNSTSSAGLSRMRNVAAPPKIPPLPKSDDLTVSAQQPRRDVAQILRGSVRQKTSTKRV